MEDGRWKIEDGYMGDGRLKIKDGSFVLVRV
jgi:hypothetical protein